MPAGATSRPPDAAPGARPTTSRIHHPCLPSTTRSSVGTAVQPKRCHSWPAWRAATAAGCRGRRCGRCGREIAPGKEAVLPKRVTAPAPTPTPSMPSSAMPSNWTRSFLRRWNRAGRGCGRRCGRGCGRRWLTGGSCAAAWDGSDRWSSRWSSRWPSPGWRHVVILHRNLGSDRPACNMSVMRSTDTWPAWDRTAGGPPPARRRSNGGAGDPFRGMSR